jgi:hypothetical protein
MDGQHETAVLKICPVGVRVSTALSTVTLVSQKHNHDSLLKFTHAILSDERML